jgi:hypothetical protein
VQQVLGNGIHLHMEGVRVNGGNVAGFNFHNVGATPINTIHAMTCYANDAEGDGWYLGNVDNYSLVACSADNNGRRTLTGYGFVLAGTHGTLIGCTVENNGVAVTRPSGGYYVPDGTLASFKTCKALSQGQPWNINAAATVMLDSCRTATITYGSALAIAGGAKVTVFNPVITGIDAMTYWKKKIGTVFYTTEAEYVVQSKTTTYTAALSDDLILGNATGGAFSVTLPTAVGCSGKRYTVKKTDSSGNAVTVATTSSQTIDGVTTKALGTQYQSVAVVSDGANWQVVG